MGADDDFILNLNSDNCPAYKKAVDTNWASFENSVQSNNKDFLTTLAGYYGQPTIDVKTALSFC
jgi:hypothetical protein